MTSVTSSSVLRWLAILVIAANALLLAACGGSGNSMTPPPPPPPPPPASNSPFWAQWGSTAQHSGAVNVAAQGLNKKLADIVYDPFVVQEQAEFGGDLVAHYQATLTDGNDFYMESKSGTYPSCNPAGDWQNGTSCGPNAWDQLTWNVTRYTWESGTPTLIWKFASDWKPEPNATGGLGGWEPVFHPVLANGFLYVPGAGGTLYKVDKNSGMSTKKIDPFPTMTIDRGPHVCFGAAHGGCERERVLQRAGAGGSGDGRSLVWSGCSGRVAGEGEQCGCNQHCDVFLARSECATCGRGELCGNILQYCVSAALSLAAESHGGASTPGLRVATAGSECGSGDCGGWDDLHSEPRAFRCDGGLYRRGEFGFDAEVGEVAGESFARRLWGAPAHRERYYHA